MRIRALKPGFFKNEDLCALSPWHRICFEGLWCCADREGRIQDRPKRLKAEIFPYDDLNMDHLLWDLARTGFIRRYVIASQPLIDLPSWDRHQHPRADEAASELAAYVEGRDRTTTTLDVTTFPAARPLSDLPTQPVRGESQVSDLSCVRAIDTGPSLSSDGSETAQRMGNGIWEVGNGNLEMGDGIVGSAANAASSSEGPSRDPCRAQDVIDLWNATTKPPLPRCRELTDDRRRKIRTRIAKRPDLAEWRVAFEFLAAAPFYQGQNDRQWVADFDWVIKNDTTMAKLLERAATARPATGISAQGLANAQAMANVAKRIVEGV